MFPRRFSRSSAPLLAKPWMGLVVVLCCASMAAGCRKDDGKLLSPSEVKVTRVETLPKDASDVSWRKVPVHPAKLIAQDLVEPRLLELSTPAVDVQAVTDGQQLTFRLSWADTTKNDLPGAARFSDACAVQVPQEISADIPAPQMGGPGKPVEVVYWSAFAQSGIEAPREHISALYPNAKVDHYPFESAALAKGSPEQTAMALRYAPARAVGNVVATHNGKPVQDLVAEGPGTLRPAARSVSEGQGSHDGQGWSVVITRPLPEGMAAGGTTQVAFAVWQGEKQEVGARKMRTPWIPLQIGASP
jgi:hypothetical protein